MNVPEIRFKGFECSWVENSLGELLDYEQPTKYLIDSENYAKHGVPVLTAGKSFVLGYTNENYGIFKSLPTIIFDDFTTDSKYVNFPFKAKSSAMKMLKKKKDECDMFFLYEALQRIPYYVANHQRHWISIFSKLKIQIPYAQEQRTIASYFINIDAQIALSETRLALLKQIKTASLQSMFPRDGETTPKLRFKGFEGEWEKVKLGQILIERHESSTITEELPQLSFTIAEGVIRPEDRKSNKRDFLIKDIVNKRYLVTKVGDIIYNPANVVYGAIHRNGLCDGVVSPIYKIFYTEQDSSFIECSVRRPDFISRLAMQTEGTVTKLKTLKPESFLNLDIMIAKNLDEQRLIGSYFTSLDHQITLQTQRLEKLKQIKSACLDKMFV